LHIIDIHFVDRAGVLADGLVKMLLKLVVKLNRLARRVDLFAVSGLAQRSREAVVLFELQIIYQDGAMK
jgi:hypothetical protein